MKSERQRSPNQPEPCAAPRERGISRRAALRQVGLGIGVLAGCSDDPPEGVDCGSGGTSATPDEASPSGVWATGGTAAMTDVASYPDPFAAGASTCPLTCRLTQGPCWAPTAPVRQDVSEGEPGVPFRLALRVVQADGCTPLQGAEVEIWYCNIDGLYSGDDIQGGNALEFCTSNDDHALSGYFCRGRAVSDAAGKLSFHGSYPGWYPGRSIHIHILVRPAANAGETTTANAVAMSQLFFPEDLSADIFCNVSAYAERGQPDTSFARDGVLNAVPDITPYVVEWQRMTDGALLAWKTIAISATESCG
jgi:protocatechuate 3,4-dioxygenase beta subunit